MKLKPCPFCGSSVIYVTFTRYYDNEDTVCVFCNTCKQYTVLERNDAEGVNNETKAEAIEAWNTRAVLTCTKETAGEGETHWYRCSNCKHAIDPGAYFCSLCGAKVVEA